MLCLYCGYYREHKLAITSRKFCALTGEREPEDTAMNCVFFERCDSGNPAFPEDRFTYEDDCIETIPACDFRK